MCRLVHGIAGPEMIARFERDPDRVAARAQMIAAAAAMTFEPLGGAEQVRRRLDRATVRTTGGELSDERLASLLDTVSEFLHMRYGQSSLARYREWRVANGYTHKPVKQVVLPEHMDSFYRFYFNSAPPADVSSASLFDALWDLGVEYGEGANRPIGMASVPAGLAVVVNEEPGDGRPFAAAEGELGQNVWNGTTTMAMRSWWASAVPAPTRGPWLCATIGIFFEFANGMRRPMMFYLRWDSSRAIWTLDGIGATHMVNADKVTALDY